jgi:flagellar protein FliS
MRPYQNYQKINISTADPVRIIVLLYEGAIQNLNQTARLFGKDNETASAKLARTLEIINYLRSALDHEKGGEVAFNLERLYDYMRDTLAEANTKRDTAKVQEVIKLLQTLLEGWRGIVSNQTTESDTNPFGSAGALPTQPINLSMVG